MRPLVIKTKAEFYKAISTKKFLARKWTLHKFSGAIRDKEGCCPVAALLRMRGYNVGPLSAVVAEEYFKMPPRLVTDLVDIADNRNARGRRTLLRLLDLKEISDVRSS